MQIRVTKYNAVVATPCARLGIQHDGERVTNIDFVAADVAESSDGARFSERVTQEFVAYFSDAHYELNVPVLAQGTPFQMRVWTALRQIARGETVTYGELARALNSGPRAVAAACRANPIPIVIPCHRVVAADGLGGYSGARDGAVFAIKPWLLRHEGAQAV